MFYKIKKFLFGNTPIWFKRERVYRDSHDNSYGIIFRSHDEDDGEVVDLYNRIEIRIGKSIYTYKAPFMFIKPVLDYIADIKKDSCVNIKEPIYSIKSYGFHTFNDRDEEEQYFFFYWKHTEDLLSNINNHKGYMKIIGLFWQQKTHIKTMLVDINSNEVMDVKDKDFTSPNNICYIDSNPKIFKKFKLIDYDGTEIEALVYFTKQHYIYGSTKCTRLIMKLFKRPISYYRYNVIFSEEIGIGKESWKGGTLAMSGPVEYPLFDSVAQILKNKYASIVEERKLDQ